MTTKLQAGREIDALVDTHVMGASGKGAPDYSTSIQAAWAVIEALEKRDIWVDTVGRMFNERNEWECEFLYGDGQRASAVADTAPLAIVLAALAACEVKERGER